MEIVLVVSKVEFVQSIIQSMKLSGMRGDVLWLKAPRQIDDLVESKGEYEGKTITDHPKIFILDASYGLQTCKHSFEIIRSKPEFDQCSFFVLSEELKQEEKGKFIKEGMTLIDDSFRIDPAEQLFH